MSGLDRLDHRIRVRSRAQPAAAVDTVPTLNIFGRDAAQVVGSVHLLIGYTVLGLLVSRKES